MGRTFSRYGAILGAMFVLMAGLVFGTGSPASAASTYYYAGGQQFLPAGVTTGGIQANLLLSPTTYVNTAENGHSLVEVDVEKGTGANRQIVEFGAIRSQAAFGDTKIRMFASTWINNVHQGCFGEGCGYVDLTPLNSADDLGRDLSADAALTFPSNVKKFEIIYGGVCSGAGAPGWFLRYNSVYLGCFPDTLWSGVSGGFTAGTAIQAFGEVVTTLVNRPCTDMGNGKQGSSVVAPIDAGDPAYIGSVTLVNPVPSTTATSLTLYNTDSSIFSYGTVGSAGNRTFTIGGPGATSTNTTPGNIGSC